MGEPEHGSSESCVLSFLCQKITSVKKLFTVWTLFIIRYSGNWKTQRFGNWMFPSSGEGGKTATQVGPLERAKKEPTSITGPVFANF
jgi:hypothetical protein